MKPWNIKTLSSNFRCLSLPYELDISNGNISNVYVFHIILSRSLLIIKTEMCRFQIRKRCQLQIWKSVHFKYENPAFLKKRKLSFCSGIKSQRVKKTICHSVPKTFNFSQKYTVPFHRFTFDHSISCVLWIDKPNESCQNSKIFKRNAISTTKKTFKKKRNSITPAKTIAAISKTSSEGLKLII